MKLELIILTSLLTAFAGCKEAHNTDKLTTEENSIPNQSCSASDYEATPKDAEIITPKNYNLIWHDEFNTDGVPDDKWTYEIGFVRNEELQWYQDDNASISGGCLIIEAKKERTKNNAYKPESSDWRENRQYAEYTSSCLTTRDSFKFKYGILEVRAKIPTDEGAWPAIWTLGNLWDWPLCGEIDIMEYYIKDGRPAILANACWSSQYAWTPIWDEGVIPYSNFISNDKKWAEKFHIWKMVWDQSYINLYLDDVLVNEIDLSQTFNKGWQNNIQNPFNNENDDFGHYILLNLAIGSNGGTPNHNAFPLKYLIDYIRVFQINDKTQSNT